MRLHQAAIADSLAQPKNLTGSDNFGNDALFRLSLWLRVGIVQFLLVALTHEGVGKRRPFHLR